MTLIPEQGIPEPISDNFWVGQPITMGQELPFRTTHSSSRSKFWIPNFRIKFYQNPDLHLYFGSCSDFWFQFRYAISDLSTFDSDRHSDLRHASLISNTQLRYERRVLRPRYFTGTFFVFSLQCFLVFLRCLFFYYYCFGVRKTPPKWNENVLEFKLKMSLL